MALREIFIRHNLIVNKLKKSAATFDEILTRLDQESEIRQMDLRINLRTFQRDLKDIEAIMGITIEFDKSLGAYHIVHDYHPEMNQRFSEAVDMLNILNESKDYSSHLLLEKRKALGSEQLFGLLHSTKNHSVVTFLYQKFWDEAPSTREVHPYALKEYKHRWYLLAIDQKDHQTKTFGLDRMTGLHITQQKFNPDPKINPVEHFKYSYGIIGGEEPQEVILSFDYYQGKYLKTLPMHESQEILYDTEEELRVRLFVYVTYDLIMEILSHGSHVEVLAPDSLRAEIKQLLTETLEYYKDE